MRYLKSFLLKLTIVAASLILADLAIGSLLSHYYHKIINGEQGRLNYAIDSVTSPMLVFGSSRAVHHYVPSILADSLHETAYNTGKDKEELYYYLAVLTATLHRYHPQTLLLDLPPSSFMSQESGLDELAILLPYYRQHPELRPIVNKRSPWEPVKTLSTLYLYNSLPLQILKRTMKDTDDDSASEGYVPEHDTLDISTAIPYTREQLTGTPDTALVAVFEQFIQLAKHDHCQLAVIVSPTWFPLPNGSSTIHLAEQICRQNNVPFLDYTRSPEFSGNTALFYDAIHLNDTGAHLFTRILCADLHQSLIFDKPHGE